MEVDEYMDCKVCGGVNTVPLATGGMLCVYVRGTCSECGA